MRVWEILVHTRSQTSLTLAKERRIRFFQDLEERGEAVILRALDTLSAHIQWILVTGGESMSKVKTGAGNRLFSGSGGVSDMHANNHIDHKFTQYFVYLILFPTIFRAHIPCLLVQFLIQLIAQP